MKSMVRASTTNRISTKNMLDSSDLFAVPTDVGGYLKML